jgi:hypothetical protein
METGVEHNNLERLTALGCQRLTWFSSETMSSKLFGLNAIAETLSIIFSITGGEH